MRLRARWTCRVEATELTVGNCYAPAVMERFKVRAQKRNKVHRTRFQSRVQAVGAVFDFIETCFLGRQGRY